MRISNEAAKQVVALITEEYGENAKIWLFGSRADDHKKGGDVDLFVEAQSHDVMRKIKCKAALTSLFDMKVDLIVGDGEKPIHRIAKASGVRLK